MINLAESNNIKSYGELFTLDRGVEWREKKQKQATQSEKGARDPFYASAAGIERERAKESWG